MAEDATLLQKTTEDFQISNNTENERKKTSGQHIDIAFS